MKYVKLNSICNFKQWHTIPTKELKDSGYPVYGANGIIGFSDKYNHDEPTIMICCRGATCGAINVSQGRCYINGNAMSMDNLSKEFDIDFVVYYLKHYDFSSIITGAAQPQITQNGLEKVMIPSIPLSEQKKIVKDLNSIDKIIKSKKLTLSSLDELIKSRFIEMFAEDIIEKRRLCKFQDICTSLIGLTYKPENVSSEGIIVLRSGNIQNGELFLEDDVVRVSGISIKEDKFVKPMDILMCSRNGSSRLVGKTCIIKEAKEKMCFGAFMAIIRTKFPYILNTFMNSDFFRSQLTGTQTASVNQITTKMLYEYDVFMPTQAEEEEFSSFVKLIDKSKFNKLPCLFFPNSILVFQNSCLPYF